MRGFSAAALHYYREPLANLTLLDPLIPSSYYLGAYYIYYSIILSVVSSLSSKFLISQDHTKDISKCAVSVPLLLKPTTYWLCTGVD